MGLPIPFLFFGEQPDGKLEVVDGSQRLRTIQQFVSNNLQIGELTELTELEGLRFEDLPESRQLKVKNRSIRGIILNEHADEQATFDIFERINTGSKIANTAEVRRGALSGPFLDLVVELAKDELFMKLAPVPEKGVYTRFESLAIGSFLAITTSPQLKKQVPDVSSWINGDEFKSYSKAGGANAKRRLRERLEFVRDRLLDE